MLSADSVKYKDNVSICRETITATPDPVTGYVEIDLVENANMTNLAGGSVTYKVRQGEKEIGDISVPDDDGILLRDIIV